LLSPQKWITATNAVGINRILQAVEENGKSTVEFNYNEFFTVTYRKKKIVTDDETKESSQKSSRKIIENMKT
jgi:ATP-dependent DNA helicase RecG